MKKMINKFFKFTYLNIPIELFILFKIMEFCLIFLGLNNIAIVIYYIDFISVLISFIFSILFTLQNIIKLKKSKFQFIDWLLGNNYK